MRITIIGAGNVGTALAADLSLKGHQVCLFKSSTSLHNDNFDYIKKHKQITRTKNGKEEIAEINTVTNNVDEAFRSHPQVIIICIQTNYHEEIIKRISGYLEDGQILLFEPGYLSTAFVLKHIKNKHIISVEAESSPIDCRLTAPGHITELFRNVKNPIGIFPKKKTVEVLNILSSLDYRFSALGSVIEAAIHNPNLIVHTIGAVMSMPRIEYTKGEYWMYKEVFTPAVWNIVESLDDEKMKVLESLHLPQTPYVVACKERNFLDPDINPKDAFFDYAYNSSPKGPNVVNSRYITEDVSQGLCLLESLGQILKIDTPVCSALISIASAALGIDFRKHGRTINTLSPNAIDVILGDTQDNSI